MALSKFEMILTMGLFEKWSFLLDNRAKFVFLKSISDCLGCDRSGDNIVDVLSGLDSIVKLFSGDLLNNCLFVMRESFEG